ncbi:recombinase RecT [Segeticoccus rhizosphaerae]|uniref:recombinase RecT n=1 Tax=Segeticoccus rhizosphaerae TaxID=1104777 RepID=UPI00126421F4|nr:recombinase RecT [Segeticoccus rhizosphaerae]
MGNISNAVAERDQRGREQVANLATYIHALTPEIQRALPKGLDGDRVARLALTLVRKSHMEAMKAGKPGMSLANCTVESFAGALLTASSLGLEPGVGGEAYLVPYKGECTLIVGYQGMAKLFYQHPMAKHLDAQAVHANDKFDYEYGTAPYLRHKPAIGDRGDIIAYYAVASLNSGATAFVVLSPNEVKALRGGKVGSSGNIPDPQHWMERKTVLRQLVKMLPKSSTFAQAIDADERTGTELRQQQRHAELEAPPAGVDTQTGEVSGELIDEPEQAFAEDVPVQDAPEEPWT